jgi:subtilisin family serine protease
VLDCNGNGPESGIIAGVDWVTINHQSPAVANMSLGCNGTGCPLPALDAAIQGSIASGVVYVVAAGNNNENACKGSPARIPEVLTVGATRNNDARANFSSFGSCLDLFAPGVNVTSAWWTSNSATATISGTSMASPHVAGVAALLLQEKPGLTPAKVANKITRKATTGKVTNAGNNSPNKLLFSRFGPLAFTLGNFMVADLPASSREQDFVLN